ncbi:type II secretion system minor pseudopilin GspI [Yersinia proxima]|uniref:Type II secretion system protein I n=1 Tax=Yersinia proxima TaxID=2890316 RepID=A0ABW9F2A0_9GAMM|nr:type II secretion system minor pseudopilin GspI [Yersinia proxima]CNL87991.1 general secretion pathway protein I [Yersinia intermedia]
MYISKKDISLKYKLGFTLLESMLSMLIFSIIGIGVMATTSVQLTRVKDFEDKIIASWVAENVLAEIKLLKTVQTEDWLTGSYVVLNKKWYWQSKEKKNNTIDIITVEVRRNKSSLHPEFILEGYHVINE